MSYAHFCAGLANSKTLDIQAAEGGAVTVTVTRPKNATKPRTSKNSTTSKKRVQRQAPALSKLVSATRPDLQVLPRPSSTRLRWCTAA